MRLRSAETSDVLILLMQAIMIVTMLTMFEFRSREDHTHESARSKVNSNIESTIKEESVRSLILPPQEELVSHSESDAMFDGLSYQAMRQGIQE